MSLPPYDQSIRDFERQYQVVLPDPVGKPAVGFREGSWFRLNSGAPHPIPIRSAIILCPHAAGSIVQIICWWMRENSRNARALDLATELALAVGELARKAIEDDPLGMSVTTLPDPPLTSPSPYGVDPLTGALPTGFAGGSMPSAFPTGSPAPAPAAAGYGDPYAGAATTLIPQIGAEPPGVLGRSGGRGGVGPTPPGRPTPVQGAGYAPGRSGGYDRTTQMPGVQMPGPRPPAQQQPGYGGRPAPGRGGDPRGGGGDWNGRPDGSGMGRPAPAAPPSYDDADPRGDYYRGGGQPRRPERDADYGGGYRPATGEYPRPQQPQPQQPPRQRPERPEPGGNRAW
jgi:hypothetical protein